MPNVERDIPIPEGWERTGIMKDPSRGMIVIIYNPLTLRRRGITQKFEVVSVSQPCGSFPPVGDGEDYGHYGY
jgi:hypothetical protein